MDSLVPCNENSTKSCNSDITTATTTSNVDNPTKCVSPSDEKPEISIGGASSLADVKHLLFEWITSNMGRYFFLLYQ